MKNNLTSIKFMFSLLDDRKHIDNIIAKLVERSDLSYIKQKNENFIIQILKVLKTLFLKINIILFKDSKETNDEVNVSLDYFKEDVDLNVPAKTIGFSDQKISFLNGLLYLYFIFKLYFSLDIEFRKNGVFKELAIGSLFYLGISSKNYQEVRYHYYSFVPEVFISCYLTTIDETINSIFYMYMRFIDPSSSIVCNRLINENEISHDFCIENKDVYKAENYSYEKKKQNIFPATSNQKNRATIGFYSSGMNARQSHGYFKKDKIEQWINTEEKVIRLLADFVLKHNNYELVIFPHYSRGVENIKGAKHYYQKFINNPNVKLYLNDSNKEEYKNINLGVTIESNVFWDRMYMGYKTILVDSLIAKDFLNTTKLKNFYINTEEASNDEFFNILIKILHKSFKDFQKDFLI